MRMKRQLTTPVMAFALAIVLSVPAIFADSHKPVFTWQYRGGSVNTEQWIYDGDIPVAMLEYRTVEQPALQLMFFNMVPKPLLLRHLRLEPTGTPLVDAVQLYCKCGHIVTDRLVGLDIKGQGTDRLVVTFETEDSKKTATSTRILTLTYDNSRETYIYDVQVSFSLNSPELFNGSSPSLEYVDPWFVGCPGPAVEFPGMWAKRYQKFVYEADDGTVKAMPINHYTTSHKAGIRLKRDGMFLTAYEPDGNPAVQLVGETADKSKMSICWWGYDFHFSRTIDPDELFGPIPAHYRILKCPAETAKSLLDKSVMPTLGKGSWTAMDEYPIYERVSGFDQGLLLDAPFDGPTDPFPWTIKGTGATWDKTSGRSGSTCLKIEKSDEGLTRWMTFQGDGEGYFAEPWTPCKGYRVSCYVKTEDVTGNGSTVAIQYHVPNSRQVYPVYTARKLTGTNGWTKLEVEVGPPEKEPEVGCLMVILQQDGSGITRFDDLEVTLIK